MLAFTFVVYFYMRSDFNIQIPLLPLLGLLLLAIATISAPLLLEPRIDFFAPVIIYMLFRVQIIGKPIIQLFKGDYSNSQLPYISQNYSYDLLLSALGIVVLGQFFYLFGYYSRIYRLLPSPKIRLPEFLPARRTIGVVLLLVLIFALSYLLIIHEVGNWKRMWDSMGLRRDIYADIKYLFLPLDILPGLILMLLALPSIQKKRFPWWIVPVVLLTIVLFAATGDRSRIIIPVFELAIFFHYLYRRISGCKLALLGFALITIALAVQDLRDTTFSGRGVDVTVLEDADYNPVAVAEEFFTRRRSIDLIGVMLYLMPERLPFQFGRTFTNIIFLPIPRSVWPEKPIIDESGIVGNALMGPSYYGLPVGTEGVLFMNFHVFGVIVGTFLLGAFHRKLYKLVQNNIGHQGFIILYSITLMHTLHLSGMGLFNAAMALVPAWVVLKYIGRNQSGYHPYLSQIKAKVLSGR